MLHETLLQTQPFTTPTIQAMQNEEEILIDQLEDQLIDHPDASTQLFLDTSLDKAFQTKLNARAEELSRENGQDNESDSSAETNEDNFRFDKTGYPYLVTRSHLQYEHFECQDLDVELSEWFVFNDYQLFGGFVSLIYPDSANENDELKRAVETLTSVASSYSESDHHVDFSFLESQQLTRATKRLLYYSFGKYDTCQDRYEQLTLIEQNNLKLYQLGAVKPIVKLIMGFLQSRFNDSEFDIQGKPFSIKAQKTLFQLLTLLYFLINVFLFNKDLVEYLELRSVLSKSGIITRIVHFMEYWKNHPNSTYRLRNLIFLLWKLLLVEMGDSEDLKRADSFLVQIHGIKNKRDKSEKSRKLICSPLDYFSFKEDLLDKYPLLNSSIKQIEETQRESARLDTQGIDELNAKFQEIMAVNDQSSTISNFLVYPRTNKSHTVLSQLPLQNIHLATPMPSPALEPSEFMSGGEKIRKSYQVNQSMPFMYPQHSSHGNVEVPLAIKEADTILKANIYDSYSDKRLWNERQKFMSQERGYISQYKNTEDYDEGEFDYDETLYDKFPDKEFEIGSILNVEKFYGENLHHLHSLVEVLLETLKANDLDLNLNFFEWELSSRYAQNRCIDFDGEARERVNFVMMQQLEVYQSKELVLKASSNIIILLLKWFKINHVLKSYYLLTVIFDQQYLATSLDFLGRSFNNTNLQAQDPTTDETEHPKDDLAEYQKLINENKLMNPAVELAKFEFFNNCHNQTDIEESFELINKTYILTLPRVIDDENINNIFITKYNKNFCSTLVNLLNIANKVLIGGVTQRIFSINELKPSELFKMLLLNYDNDYLNKPTLKILKKLVPYQGRKWKSMNMDLISLIYLNLRLSLKDNWLSGKDLESDYNKSFDQEVALRCMLQFYNMRKYPDQMEHMGYSLSFDSIPDLSI